MIENVGLEAKDRAPLYGQAPITLGLMSGASFKEGLAWSRAHAPEGFEDEAVLGGLIYAAKHRDDIIGTVVKAFEDQLGTFEDPDQMIDRFVNEGTFHWVAPEEALRLLAQINETTRRRASLRKMLGPDGRIRNGETLLKKAGFSSEDVEAMNTANKVVKP